MHRGYDSLAGYGADTELLRALTTGSSATGHPLRPGRVARTDRGGVVVVTEDGWEQAVVPPPIAGFDLAVAPVTGDWVALSDDPELGTVVARVGPRHGVLRRRDPAERDAEQVLAANVDVVALVVGADRPLNLRRVERWLVVAHDSGAQPLVVIAKADLLGEEARAVVAAELAEVTGPSIGPGLVVSSRTGLGLEELRASLRAGRTVVLLGESGVGKSSLANALLGADRQLVGEVRAVDAKGRHTTTARELFAVPGGAVLIDTPGLRSVGLWEADDGLIRAFADIEELAARCRFRDCRHVSEPGCAVQAAVRDHQLSARRLASYLDLDAELDQLAGRQEERRRRTGEGRRRRR